ncbi:hypothetical protein IKO70_05985 [bacterium]|nr:hypothetical protein [bacterium]
MDQFIKCLKRLPADLQAAALCITLSSIFCIYNVCELWLRTDSSHMNSDTEIIISIIVVFCIFSCITNISTAVFIVMKKRKTLDIAFFLILLLMIFDYICSCAFIEKHFALFVFQGFVLPAYILMLIDSIKIKKKQPLLHEYTKFYSIAALLATVFIKTNLLPIGIYGGNGTEPTLFMSAGLILYLIYILRNKNKFQ